MRAAPKATHNAAKTTNRMPCSAIQPMLFPRPLASVSITPSIRPFPSERGVTVMPPSSPTDGLLHLSRSLRAVGTGDHVCDHRDEAEAQQAEDEQQDEPRLVLELGVLMSAPIQATRPAIAPPTIAKPPRIIRPVIDQPNAVNCTPVTSGPSR